MTYVCKLNLEKEEMDIVRKATKLSKQSMTGFVSYSALQRAKEVLRNESEALQ